MSNPISKTEYQATLDELHLEIGRAIDEWSRVEQWLHDTFVGVIVPPMIPPALSASFWAVQSFDAKLQLVSEAVFNQTQGPVTQPPGPAQWRPLRNKLQRINKERNKLAHGAAVSPVAVVSGPPVALPVWVPYYDSLGYRMFKSLPPQSRYGKAKQFEEFSANDIRHKKRSFVNAQHLIAAFYKTNITKNEN